MRRRAFANNELLLFMAMVAVAAAILFPILAFLKERTRKSQPQSAIPGSVAIFLAGDVMLGRGVAGTLARADSNLRTWRPYSESADLAFANLEGALSNGPIPKTGNRLLVPLAALTDLREAGFDVLSTANNHALDNGEPGVQLLQKHWGDNTHWQVGTKLGSGLWPTVRTPVRGRTIAWVAASSWGPFRAGQANVREARSGELLRQVRELAALGDDVIVSLHWGREYERHPGGAQRTLARALIDAGAKAVVGHHPHVSQSIEVYHGRPILYSLGNFVFDRTPKAQSGLAVLLRLEGERVMVRSLKVQPEVARGDNDAKTLTRGLVWGRFLPNIPGPEKVVWTHSKAGRHQLQIRARVLRHWMSLAHGQHADIRQMRVGDVDGDGLDEVWLELRQRSKLDVRVRPRLHIYKVALNKGFRPVWRGSGLSRPFSQWGLMYRPGSWQADLVAIEQDARPDFREFQWISLYRWNGFGFRRVWDHPVRGQIQLTPSSVPRPWLPVEVRSEGKLRRFQLSPGTKSEGLTISLGQFAGERYRALS